MNNGGASLTSPRRTVLKIVGGVGFATTFQTGIISAQPDGRQVWVNEIGDLVVSSPTVVGEMVYVGTNGSNIYGINKSTGDEEWVFETDGFVNSSPVVAGDTLYIGSNDNNVYAINRNTGEQQWQFDTGDNIRSSPVVAGGTVFIGNGDFRNPVDTSVYAINANTGKQEWKYQVGDRISSAPVVDDETVYVTSTDNSLYALDTTTGSLNWSKDIGAGEQSSPTINDETVYVVGSGVTALDKSTGDEQWNYETDASFINSTPTVANNTLYIGISSKNKLSAIDIDTGSDEWSFQTGGVVNSSPTFVNGTVFIGSNDGKIYSVDADSGEENWEFQADSEISSSPTVVDGILYVGTIQRDPYGGSVYALNTDLDGSSEGSRTRLGTLGHHGDWAYADQRISGEENRDAFLIEPVNPTVKAGSTTGIDVEVTNKLSEPATDIEGKLFADDPLDSTNDEVFIESLDPGETTTVTVDLSASGRATAKNYTVSMDFRYTDDNGDSKLTDAYRTAITVESSSVQPPSSGIIESNQMMIVIGGVGTIGASLYAWQRSRGSDDDTASTESSTVETDIASQATANSTTEDDTATANELQEQAIEAIDRAERAAEYSDYEMAVESYEAALTHLKGAAAEAADPDIERELESTLAETEAALDSVTTRQEHRDSIATTLQAAERSFKEGIARYAAAEQTVARIRFRQARDAFEEAQQAIEVSFEQEATLPSMAVENLVLLEESTVKTLSSVDIDSITDLESDPENEEVTPAVVSDLKESDEISSEEAALLTLLSWWYEGASREFNSETVISRRYEQADYGFNQST